MHTLNETHDPKLTSWISSANGETDFPIQNLPFGIFRRAGSEESFRGGVAIGDKVVDLAAAHAAGLFEGSAAEAAAAASGSTLNDFMQMGSAAWSALRLALSRALRTEATGQMDWSPCLVDMADVEMGMPATVGDYTDFYTSIHHATNIGKLFRPDNPLLPNYKWIPIGYHGRASSVVLSGFDFHRPVGQQRPAPGEAPGFGPSKRMDYEMELGVFVGPGNALGDAISIEDAEKHIFGLCILNDWSARDLQAWEYQPLGPFLGKNFATSISPWIVTMEALAPFRAAFTRDADEPQTLPYLTSEANSAQGALEMKLEVLLETSAMREAGTAPERLSLGDYKHAYWTMAQMVTHHTVNGCNLRAGDLFGTGTLSGPEAGMEGALIEITKSGKEPVILANGETRTFLEDGDVLIMRAWCEGPGAVRIGLGECRGQVLPAKG